MRLSAAMNSMTPAEVLVRLAKDEDSYVRRAAARNSQTPAEALSMFVTDEDEMVRLRLAEGSQNVAQELLLLAKDKAADVRRAVAKNSLSPAEALSLLVNDEDETVRSAVARNTQTDCESLSLLAQDEVEDVLRAVAGNRNTPKQDISRICSLFFAEIFALGCNGSEPSPGRRFLLTLPQCPADVLAKNFRSRSWLERYAIAGNSSTPEAVLEKMAKEGNQLVRMASQKNLECRPSAAEALDQIEASSAT